MIMINSGREWDWMDKETKKMDEEELKILEKQLSHFIKWLGNNRPYQEGLLYGDMKDYLTRLNHNKDD
jgi:hypothetical protein